ncbi:hypothetical protein VNI00_014136 [Paramarasmius palmivorus]|uniref:Cupin type-1 domain-containing protein n=1 Tax=Paramarasmius palmivorus TaxID=297713 RepID=A0AAW0BUG7_9AGAR
MSFCRSSLFTLLSLCHIVWSAPASPSLSSSAIDTSATVSFASTELNPPLWGPDSPASVPQPERGSLGAPIIGPSNSPLELENPDVLAPPTTDNGQVGNAKWPFSFSSNRIQTGGWARQQNANLMPLSQNIAGVNMRLEAGAIRELHWHSTSEWAYVLKGTTQVTSVDAEGRNFRANAKAGDLWFFPAGIPHSLQATADDPEGSEFILVFPDGDFSEDDTFLLTDWLAHVPAEVIQKNFQINSPQPFSRIPAKQLYIFPGTPPDTTEPVSDPNGQIPQAFTFAFSDVTPTPLAGGTVKIVDSRSFPISTTISAAEVTVDPGALRELHWHPTMDEWAFFLEGEGRMTVFASQSNARTFNYQAGDIAAVPASMGEHYHFKSKCTTKACIGHYVENTGNTTLRFLEIFNTDIFQDVSLSQWLALTPPELLKAHLGLDDDTIANLNKTKATVVAPLNTN